MTHQFNTENFLNIRKTGIYFLFHENIVVYIGQSECVMTRVPQHNKDKEFDSWNYMECKKSEINELEADMILKYKPEYNKAVPKNKKWVSKNILKHSFGISKHAINKLLKNKEFKRTIKFNDWYFLYSEVHAKLILKGK